MIASKIESVVERYDVAIRGGMSHVTVLSTFNASPRRAKYANVNCGQCFHTATRTRAPQPPRVYLRNPNYRASSPSKSTKITVITATRSNLQYISTSFLG